jgi:hypothetical protein
MQIRFKTGYPKGAEYPRIRLSAGKFPGRFNFYAGGADPPVQNRLMQKSENRESREGAPGENKISTGHAPAPLPFAGIYQLPPP